MNNYTPKHMRYQSLDMRHAFEFAVDGSFSDVCAATVFGDSEKEARKVLWSLLDEDQKNMTASVEMVWNYATDGAQH